MKLNLFELLAPLFQATAAGHATVDAPKPGVFAGLLLQLQSGTPGTKQTDNPLPVTHPEAFARTLASACPALQRGAVPGAPRSNGNGPVAGASGKG